MKHTRYSTLLRLLLALIALAGLYNWAADVGDRFRLGLHPDRVAKSPFELSGDTPQLSSIELEAAQAGLRKGATLASLNGIAYTGLAQWDNIRNAAEPGDRLLVGFRRANGSSANAVVVFAAEPDEAVGFELSRTLQDFVLYSLVPLLCMLVGYWVVFVKPGDPNAWFLLFLLLSPQGLFALRTGGWSTGAGLVLRGIYFELFQTVSAYTLLLFALYFPERSRVDVRLPWLKWVVLGFGALFLTTWFRLLYGRFFLAGNPPWLLHFWSWSYRADNALVLLCCALYVLILLDKARSAATADNRRRLRVLLAGTVTGIAALLGAFVIVPDLGYSGHRWLDYLGAILFLLAPLTLAYVVLVQRAMDVRILLRQGTRYLLARGTVLFLQGASLLAIAYFLLLPLLRKEQVPPLELLEVVLLLAFAFALRAVLGKRMMRSLDRRFFREAYDSEQVLSDLAVEVRRYTESGPLLQTVAKCVAETLHVSHIAMLLRAGPEFRLAEAAGALQRNGHRPALALTSSTIRRLNNSNAPAELYRDAPEAWYMLAGAQERRTLDELGAELLLALPGRDRLMGVMALGPKQSEAAYSRSDLRLLEALAGQTGMALEVSELAHSLAAEAAGRERADREMEIAREVQERFFPQAMPPLAAGSVAGHCRPALGVGGDYFDVFSLDDGRLGIAVGDVSGKGISAALLMASLRASLRGTVMGSPRDFAKLMDKVNRLVYEASASNRYATFFFGALDPETLLLECVNAGHNAPLVLRRRNDAPLQVLRLEADGPVVGLLPFAPYSEQRLQLQPGDLLVAYTDGISEAMTREDEEWGEERMVAAASGGAHADAGAVLAAIFAEADRFTAGAPQHDDMTVLVLKLDAVQV